MTSSHRRRMRAASKHQRDAARARRPRRRREVATNIGGTGGGIQYQPSYRHARVPVMYATHRRSHM